MTDAALSSPALTWRDAFMGLLPSLNAVLQGLATAIIAIGTTLATQHVTAPKPMRIPAADSIPTPAPVLHVDTDPIVKAIEAGFAKWAAAQEVKGNVKSVRAIK